MVVWAVFLVGGIWKMGVWPPWGWLFWSRALGLGLEREFGGRLHGSHIHGVHGSRLWGEVLRVGGAVSVGGTDHACCEVRVHHREQRTLSPSCPTPASKASNSLTNSLD